MTLVKQIKKRSEHYPFGQAEMYRFNLAYSSNNYSHFESVSSKYTQERLQDMHVQNNGDRAL